MLDQLLLRLTPKPQSHCLGRYAFYQKDFSLSFVNFICKTLTTTLITYTLITYTLLNHHCQTGWLVPDVTDAIVEQADALVTTEDVVIVAAKVALNLGAVGDAGVLTRLIQLSLVVPKIKQSRHNGNRARPNHQLLTVLA
jgi:hypothetical protein